MQPKRTIPRDLRDDQRIAARFWIKVQISGADDCWEWTAGRHSFGYGKFGIGGRVHFGHRVAWALTNGPIPPDLCILHRCDNPPCCNPSHLYVGTKSDNMHDMWNRSRHPQPRRVRLDIPTRGRQGAHAKLTREQVLAIRQAAADGLALRVIAAQYDVTKQAIHAVITRRSWQHV